ncbi:MAG TPA: ATP-binding cassette domain-containing protein [Acholeplasmataceae bacterium]|nr:ATP-binding cassette domain-containing protein [Acholeplasmataceae bacterium]
MVINKGDIYGFIGENGAGKTTVIRLITALANPTSGDYEIFGVPNNDPKVYDARKKVSAIVESPSLYLNMTAYNNLLVQCKLLGIKDLSEINKVLDVVGLSYLVNNKKKVKHFSLGMKQRLGLAIALLGKPEFILLDEPMNGLDPEGIVDIRNLILQLNKEHNITFLISSHILGELSKLVNKYGFISRGKLIKEITVEELEKEIKHGVELVVSNVEKAINVFKSLNITSLDSMNNNTIRIYDDIDITSIITSLDKENIQVKSIAKIDENIEDYYLKLIGGNRNA